MHSKKEDTPILKLNDLETGYGKKQIIFGVSLEVFSGEIVAIIGPNGAGKSTILKTICGLIPIWKGKVHFNGNLVNGLSPSSNIKQGITFAPQGNRVFNNMTVMENLEIGGVNLPNYRLKTRIEEVFKFFPVLKNRLTHKAGKLSGGEQQMLALARALIPNPKFLMLDEPSLGLSPKLVDVVFNKVLEISHEQKIGILIVEQKVRQVLDICQRVYSMKLGTVMFSGNPKKLKEDPNRLKQLFL